MSLENVAKIIDKALVEDTFRERLFHHPMEILDAYDLEDHERSMLARLGSAPYTLSLQGLSEARRMVEAAMMYNPAKKEEARL